MGTIEQPSSRWFGPDWKKEAHTLFYIWNRTSPVLFSVLWVQWEWCCFWSLSTGGGGPSERDVMGVEKWAVTVQLPLQIFFSQEVEFFRDSFTSLKCLRLFFLSPSGFRFYECDWPADWQREAFLHHDTVWEGQSQVTLFRFCRTDCCFLHPLLSCVQSGNLILVVMWQFCRTKPTWWLTDSFVTFLSLPSCGILETFQTDILNNFSPASCHCSSWSSTYLYKMSMFHSKWVMMYNTILMLLMLKTLSLA